MSARSLDAAKVVIGEACRASAVLHTLLHMFENVCNKKEKALLMLASASENRFVSQGILIQGCGAHSLHVPHG